MNNVVIRIHLSEGRVGIDCTNTPMTENQPLPANVTVKFEDYDWTTDEHGFSQGTKHHEPETMTTTVRNGLGKQGRNSNDSAK